MQPEEAIRRVARRQNVARREGRNEVDCFYCSVTNLHSERKLGQFSGGGFARISAKLALSRLFGTSKVAVRQFFVANKYRPFPTPGA